MARQQIQHGLFIYLFLFIEIHQHVQSKYKNIQQAFNLRRSIFSTKYSVSIALTETVGREDTSDNKLSIQGVHPQSTGTYVGSE